MYSKTLMIENENEKQIFIKSIYEYVYFELNDLYLLVFESAISSADFFGQKLWRK